MVKYFFTDDEVSADFAKDIAVLQEVPLEVTRALVQATLKILSGEVELASVDELNASLEPLAGKAGVSVKVLADTVRTLTLFFRGAAKKNLRGDQIDEDMTTFGVDEDRRAYVQNAWKAQFVAVSRSLLAQTLSVYPLLDLDWRFGVTASSSELNEVGSTFLQLKLVLDKGANRTENVFVELSLSQFYEFLHQMEKAKASIDYFSS